MQIKDASSRCPRFCPVVDGNLVMYLGQKFYNFIYYLKS
jgi:hypothetical protein